MSIIIIVAIIAILILWAISVQRKLVVMDENINNAMSQIGVQLSSRFDALTALLDAETPAYTAVTILADKEETGSDGNTGMQGAFLEYFIDDIAADVLLHIVFLLCFAVCDVSHTIKGSYLN